jgi:Protein of unknown function (DUF3305)
MNVETSPLNRNDALQKVGPIAAYVMFERAPRAHNGWRLVGVSPMPFDENPACICSVLELWLHRDEGEGYYLNLESPEPSFFVKWRLKEVLKSGLKHDDSISKSNEPEAIALSLSYNEGGRWLDGGESVDRVLMPQEMLPWLAEFTQLHYEPEGKKKKRGPKPSFMSRTEFSDMTTREIDIHKATSVPKENS